jgi:beta-lactamase class A
MEPIYYTELRRRSSRKFPVILLVFDLLVIVTFFFAKIQVKSTSEYVLGKGYVSPVENVTSYPTLPPPSPTPSPTPSIILPSASLEQALQDALIGASGSYGIVVRNLKTKENYSFNEHIKYESASLYKLWIMAETFEQIKSGTLKETDILNGEAKTLNNIFNIASESAQLSEGTIILSVNDALNKMITISDNYAALLLGSRIRLSKVESFLKINGFKESNIGITGGMPMTTAYDTAVFFEKLYLGKLVNEEYSNKMLQLLKAQKLNSKIPKYLAPNIVVAHKTGELDKYSHDAGIVYTQNGDYIIVVLSKSDDPNSAKNLIATISKAVFNYFQEDK